MLLLVGLDTRGESLDGLRLFQVGKRVHKSAFVNGFCMVICVARCRLGGRLCIKDMPFLSFRKMAVYPARLWTVVCCQQVLQESSLAP